MKLTVPAGLAAGLVTVALAPAAQAAPVTVDLRIEGASRTLFEGPVTTGVRGFRFTNDPATYRCNGTAATGGSSPRPVPTRGAVIAEAAELARFSLEGTWHPQFGASFTEIAGEPVGYDPATGRFLAEYENGAFASVGACADPVEGGDEVLFAYADGSETLLELRGPSRSRPGRSVRVRVVDAASGAPVRGATVGGETTGADGRATVGPLAGDHVDLKATRDGAIRSNRLRVCLTGDGCGGERDSTAPLATIRGISDGRRFARGPRELRGRVSADPAGVRAVRLSLRRKVRGRCAAYSGRKERFVRRRCGRALPFRVQAGRRWRYLLPERLGRGRYVLTVLAVDGAGQVDRVRRGRNHVVFRVR